MKVWDFSTNGHSIKVTNSLFRERLYVDGELQDERSGVAFSRRLCGQFKSGEDEGDKVKVSLGGFWTVGCVVFVDDSEVFRAA